MSTHLRGRNQSRRPLSTTNAGTYLRSMGFECLRGVCEAHYLRGDVRVDIDDRFVTVNAFTGEGVLDWAVTFFIHTPQDLFRSTVERALGLDPVTGRATLVEASAAAYVV